MRRGEDGELLVIFLCGLKGIFFFWVDVDYNRVTV